MTPRGTRYDGARPGRLETALADGRFAVTAEITPPATADPERLLAKARPLRDCTDAVNVTDGAAARAHLSSLAAAAILAGDGIEPVMQTTCRDRNRLALQSDLLGAAALGVRNIMVLRGDDPTAGDQPDAKPVFDWESRDVLAAAAAMAQAAVLPGGRAIDGAPRFFLGAADLPVDPAPEWRPENLRVKMEAGARFVQTQFCFDMEVVRRYVARLGEDGLTERLKILIGIGPLASARSATWMRDNLFGTLIPERIVQRLRVAGDPKVEGIRVCAELLRELAEIPGVAGAHLMAPANAVAIPAAIEESGVLTAR